VAWLLPELEVGVEPELRPLPELVLVEPELVEPELVEPELVEPELVEPELVEPELVEPVLVEPELVEPELVEPELVEPEEVELVDELESVLWVEPGRTRASAPAVTTLARLTAVVVERTLLRPRALSATAWRTPSRSVLLMSSSVGPRIMDSLDESSR
jgi:hypothetical protein